MDDQPKKSLGQHWLDDPTSLQAICDLADLKSGEVVLEIGPGQGSLTHYLLDKGARVIAVEKDEALAEKLQAQNLPNLLVATGDVLQFDFSQMPLGYKIAANIPYYLTSHLLRILSETDHPPLKAVLLLQKEVAQRVCGQPGKMSLLSIAVQLNYLPSLGPIVPAKLFKPPPKVDSQVLVLRAREEPLFKNLDRKLFFRVVKAGFSEKRKKLRGSLSGGLGLSKDQADKLLKEAAIDGDLRAQNLSLEQWYHLSKFVSLPTTYPDPTI